VESTASQAIDPDWVEAMAFAWFAYKNKSGEAANAPSVTGASRPTVLGGYYSHR